MLLVQHMCNLRRRVHRPIRRKAVETGKLRYFMSRTIAVSTSREIYRPQLQGDNRTRLPLSANQSLTPLPLPPARLMIQQRAQRTHTPILQS